MMRRRSAVGRWFVVTVVLAIALELNSGLLLGAQDFTFFNTLRFAQPAMMAASYLVLWGLGSLTVTTALIAPTVGTGNRPRDRNREVGEADRPGSPRLSASVAARSGMRSGVTGS